MSCSYKIRKSCLRYLVPFTFTEEFDKVIEDVDKQKLEFAKANKTPKMLWERKTATTNGTESDLYSYIKNEFCFDSDNEILSDKKSGCEWLYFRSTDAANKDGKPIKELYYCFNGIKNNLNDKKQMCEIPDAWRITITNVGLVLFRNSLGFVWYELKLPEIEINSDQLVIFQNAIKELNRAKPSLLWEKTMIEPQYGVVLSEDKWKREYLTPFHFGNWINELIGFLGGVSYFAERKNSFTSMLKNSVAKINDSNNEDFTDESKNYMPISPDKAILFSYIVFDNKCEKDTLDGRYSLTYQITNGYKESYHSGYETKNEIKCPFDDVMWYATQEGVSYLAWPTCDNIQVFSEEIQAKVKTDYFTLFIKNLYQSYSLLIYANKIQSEISAISCKYLEMSADQNITDLFWDINLFLTKSMATSVSHIHHQSEFYIYLKKQLRVQEDVESVTSGLNALDLLQRERKKREDEQRNQEAWKEEKERDREEQKERNAREEREKKRDEKLQAIMGLLTLLGIASALVDSFDFVNKFQFNDGEFWNQSGCIREIDIVCFIIIGIISVIGAIFAIKAIFDAFGSEIINYFKKLFRK